MSEVIKMAKKGMSRPEADNKRSAASMCKTEACGCHKQEKNEGTQEHKSDCCKHDSHR